MELPKDIRLVARKAVLDEISFRMDKLWRIFSWTSTLLIAITGGIVALQTGVEPLTPEHRLIVAGSALVLAAYATIWLHQNLKLERQARNALASHDKAMGIASYNETIGGGLPRPDIGVIVGYHLTVILLAIAATAAAFVPFS